MSLNTYVAGEPASIRTQTEGLRGLAAGAEDDATGWHRTRSESEADWDGQAADAYRDFAGRNGRDADTFEQLLTDLARAEDVFADDLNTVKNRMGQAMTVAHEGQLTVMDVMIFHPVNPSSVPSIGKPGSAPESTAQNQAEAEQFAKQQAAYKEAQQIVADARQLERTAHQHLGDALNAATNGLRHLGEREAWSQAAANATSPAATNLASAAAAMENHAAGATKAAFENALSASPAQTAGMWSSMTSAQRSDLKARFPQMIGNADGLPVTVRHEANMRTLQAERSRLVAQLRKMEALSGHASHQSPRQSKYVWQEEQLQQALDGLDAIADKVDDEGNYLLAMDSTANQRGQVIIANGNPDKADHVVTTVPGTYSDMGDAMNYVNHGANIANQAEAMGNGSVASVTWVGYDSPETLFTAGREVYAEQGSQDLSDFQKGLRASHEGEPSHNTVISHSYGTTTTGYAARDHGLPVDDMVFIGSPGVGVDQASGLGIPPEHVWSGTSNLDLIDYLTPSADYHDWFNGRDDHWYGTNPSDPQFGGRELPVGEWEFHGGYWTNEKSVDSMARVVAGETKGSN